MAARHRLKAIIGVSSNQTMANNGGVMAALNPYCGINIGVIGGVTISLAGNAAEEAQ